MTHRFGLVRASLTNGVFRGFCLTSLINLLKETYCCANLSSLNVKLARRVGRGGESRSCRCIGLLARRPVTRSGPEGRGVSFDGSTAVGIITIPTLGDNERIIFILEVFVP